MSKRSVNLLRKIKGDFNVSAAGFHVQNRPTINAAASSTTTLVAADSGRVVLLAPNAAICVLPAPVVGMSFLIVHTGAFDTTKSEVRTDAGTSLFRGGHAAKNGSDCAKPGSTDDRAEFTTASEAGDHIEVVCISATEWFVRGIAATSTSLVYTDGGS